MYWTIFHIIKYLDIAAMVLITGYTCYEFFYAWSHDKKVEPTLISKIFGLEISEEELKQYHELKLDEVMFGIAMLGVLLLAFAFTWPVSIPISIAVGVAFYIREAIRKKEKTTTDG